MAQFFEPSTDTNANFANSVSGQANSFFLPSIYSKKVLNFFRKASVVEAITNTDYAGEISAFGDSVKIIKEPVISVSSYTRNTDTSQTMLTDQELNLVVDQANAFKFIVLIVLLVLIVLIVFIMLILFNMRSLSIYAYTSTCIYTCKSTYAYI